MYHTSWVLGEVRVEFTAYGIEGEKAFKDACATINGMSENEFWLMPIGLFLDLWACHKQFLGLEKAARELTIDDIIQMST